MLSTLHGFIAAITYMNSAITVKVAGIVLTYSCKAKGCNSGYFRIPPMCGILK